MEKCKSHLFWWDFFFLSFHLVEWCKVQMSVNHFVKKDDLHYNIIAQICSAENFDRSDITLRKASSSMVPLLTAAEAVIKLFFLVKHR